MNGKHAYIIAAHNNLYVLEKLIDLLDDPRNDLFIHIDIKCSVAEQWIARVRTSFSKLVFIRRRNVMWGGYSQVNLTLDMLEESTKGNYDWYHFIGGTSLPIKTQDEIHNFFDNDYVKHLYFHVNIGTFKLIQDRAKAYYPFIENTHFRKNKVLKVLSIVIGKIQILCGINRLRGNELAPLYNGWSWFSIPHDFANELLTKRELIEKTFKYTLASDEVWLHSIAVHSNKYRPRTYGLNGRDDPIDASKHFQDWKRGKPYVFHKEDYEIADEKQSMFLG